MSDSDIDNACFVMDKAIARISSLEAALSEAQQEVENRDETIRTLIGLSESATQQVTQQAATISHLRDALEKIAEALTGKGMSVGYESSAGLEIAHSALADIRTQENPS